MSTEQTSSVQISPGTVLIGTYEISEHINTGGMGEVYKGFNIHNKEIVAIKVVLPALAHDEKILSLFQKESTVLRKIANDAIVRYEVFTIDPGIARPCLVMEFVDGPSLRDYMHNGPMDEEQVLLLLRRLAWGLDIAHRAGVVHRDLSPDNVILCEGVVENAKIIDFGIAKETTPGGATLIGGQFAGKPGYVAPEQLGLYDGTVTGQADVYSLGLLAAAAALGRPIYMGDSPATAVRSRLSVPEMEGVPPRLHAILSKMLEPDPAHRPDGMSGVIAMIDEVLGPGGRSMPPVTQPPYTIPPGARSLPPEDATQLMGVPPAASVPPEQKTMPPKKKGGAGKVILALILLAGVGGAGAWFAGLIPGAGPSPLGSVASVLSSAPPIEEQRAWTAQNIATYQGDCTWLQGGGEGEGGALKVSGFANQGGAFDGFGKGFSEAHDLAPDLSIATVSAEQCGALGFLASLNLPGATTADAPPITPDQPEIIAGAPIAGTIGAGPAGSNLALLLVDPMGRLQNVTSEVVGDRFTLPARRMRMPDNAPVGPMLLVALRTPAPVATVSLIPENAILPANQVSEFWKFLASDIGSAGSGVSVSMVAVPFGS